MANISITLLERRIVDIKNSIIEFEKIKREYSVKKSKSSNATEIKSYEAVIDNATSTIINKIKFLEKLENEYYALKSA